MDAEREREIRELAARLRHSKRHRRIGFVLDELLAEVDALRSDDETATTMSFAEARQRILDYADQSRAAGIKSDTETWSDAARRRARDFAPVSQSHT